MCGGVEYPWDGKQRKTYFPMAYAQLPILMRSGNIRLFEWGRREREPGALPATGWARMDSIQDGKWDRFEHRTVRIIVDRYMEKDRDRNSHWFKLELGYYIQGLMCQKGDERRVYIVTEQPPTSKAHIHDRWPRIKFDPRRSYLRLRVRHEPSAY